ncbi:hypothetical protein QYH69_35685 [Paraburkholderia sp. SARCC-3016]|uniref:hypothetical protein n=1 Tax=Paraburkholderia sp. SARCC-3016 TaxID=3058611 RepID=UPI00280866E2|nr:hypothetical protein [Paraburkholderia sp. SARCC-3016]MDQ7982538.1 hypothetical protein [Paraburkholderia sp. SARCC-3016]
MLNEVRPNLLHPAKGGKLPSNSKRVGQISDRQLNAWYDALSVSKDDVKKMESAAYWAGMFVPTSGSIFNMISYLVVPFATQKIKNPWVTAAISLGVVAVQPVVTSPMQSLVIGAIDYYRRLGQPEVKLDKGNINSKSTQSDIRKKIDDAISSAHAKERAVVQLFEQHGCVGAHGQIDERKLAEKIAGDKLSPEDKKALIDACNRHLDALVTLCSHAGEMQALDGAHARQVESTLWQIPARTVRSGSGALAPFIRQSGAQAPRSTLDHLVHHKLSPSKVTGVSACIALMAIVMQHLAAARDEVNGLRLEHKLNILHADFFNHGGKDAAIRRGKITSADLDEAKCRNMVALPEATIVQRVADRVDAQLKVLTAELERQRGTQAGPGALEQGVADGDPELKQRIAAYQKDVENLRKLTLPDDMHEDTKALLEGALKGSPGFALGEAYGKLTKPLEFSSQVSQRLGQTFTLGALGSAGATAGGRFATAAMGGSSHISLTVQFVLALASALIGVFAATTQGMVTNIKNQRRDAKPEEAMGFMTQFGKGVGAPIVAGYNAFESWRGLSHAGAAFSTFEKQATHIGASLEQLDSIATAREHDLIESDNDVVPHSDVADDDRLAKTKTPPGKPEQA